jgi:DNA-binding NtrC family response regulator
MDTVLLVEDKAELREMLVQALGRMGYEVVPAADRAGALVQLAARRFAVVLTDLKLPAGSGMDVLKAALEADGAVPVILMTAYGSVAEAVAAMRDGAYDFIQKPLDLEHLRHLLGRAIERQQLLRENVVLKEEFSRRYGFPRIVGEHPAMAAAAREMQRIAPTEMNVLLLGESGTGKELFAQAIHQLSFRAAKPFLALNCAAIPEGLIENELFGHERGAFTGANSRKLGKFELAHGGTIFLDEIGDLPANAQGKLLRVIEERYIERLGGSGAIQVDVRVVAATNRDLESAIQAGAFRRDLYYRLAVFPIVIPPLRERGDDVVLIAEHLLERFRRELRKPKLKLTADAISALRAYSWPGNIRELQNVLERAAILQDAQLTAADLGLAPELRLAAAAAGDMDWSGTLSEVSGRALRSVERAKIEATLRDCKWNKAAAAQRLGVSYKTLLTKIHAYGLD